MTSEDEIKAVLRDFVKENGSLFMKELDAKPSFADKARRVNNPLGDDGRTL